MKTDTPETDAEAKRNSLNGRMMADEVPADFARKLERQLNHLRDFAESVRRINNAPIDASDAMDEIDTLLDMIQAPESKP